MAPNRLLVVGVERSGTTWVAKALAQAMRAVYVHEPDNPSASPGASHARQYGKYPIVRPGDPAPLYAQEWDLAFRGGFTAPKAAAPIGRALTKVPGSVRQPLVGLAARFSKAKAPADRVLTKSVMCAFSLDWIVERYEAPVVWVRRNPLNVVASLVELGTTLEHMDRLYRRYRDPVLVEALVKPMSLPELPDGIDLVEQCAYWVGLNTAGYQSSATLYGNFATVDHDALCADPSMGFQRLSTQLGLEWNEAAEEFLLKSNKEGEGFETNRITALEPDRWRRSLSDREGDLRGILSQFPGTFVS